LQVADYLSHLPASTLPISLHHFLKYSAENIKKESESVPSSTASSVQIGSTATSTPTSVINVNTHHPSNNGLSPNGNAQQQQSAQQQLHLSQQQQPCIINPSLAIKKKKKKKAKEKKARLKPGEIRLVFCFGSHLIS